MAVRARALRHVHTHDIYFYKQSCLNLTIAIDRFEFPRIVSAWSSIGLFPRTFVIRRNSLQVCLILCARSRGYTEEKGCE